MKKHKNVKLIAIFSILLILICCIPAMAYSGSKDKVTLKITKDPVVGEVVKVQATAGANIKKISWSLSLDGKKVLINFNKNGGTFIPEKAGTYVLKYTVSGKNTSKTYTQYIEVEGKEEITTEKQTTSKVPVTTEEQTTSKVPVTTEKQTTTKKPVEETTTQEETTTVASNEMKITLNAPEIVMTGDVFDVSYVANNCPNIEWYINGEYQAALEKQIKPSGTLQFDKAGIYSLTVIGYTEDWSKNVSSSVYVRVYDDLAQANGNAKEHDRAMYSWGHHYIYEEYEEILQKVMELTECNILYQEIGVDADLEDVAAFLERRGENNQTVYYLCGNASWSIEKDAKSMLEQVQRAIEYNKAAGEHKFVGIQFDVEPYCLTDFDENAEEYFAQYVKNSKLAYQAAHEAGLLVEICIPYWWDYDYGFDDELVDLITNACDSVAVMNYYKKQKEISHIENELELCRKLDKRIINITETIPPGLHDLTEDNTYYHDGIDAIEEMWNTLDGFFLYDKLGYAFHYLDVIIELLGLE